MLDQVGTIGREAAEELTDNLLYRERDSSNVYRLSRSRRSMMNERTTQLNNEIW